MIKELRKIDFEEKPNIIQNLGNNKYYYIYDIEEKSRKIKNFDTEEIEEKTYFYGVVVKMYNKPTYSECVKSIIRLYFSQDEEFDLINSYNKAILSNDLSNKAIEEYQEYLDLLDEIKSKVKKDFNF